MIREFHQISLRTRNSFGVDQQAARLAEFETPEDLRTFFAAGIPRRWLVLAGGNNILFTRDYDGVLLTPVARQITLLSDDGEEVRVRADAGVEWDDLAKRERLRCRTSEPTAARRRTRSGGSRCTASRRAQC